MDTQDGLLNTQVKDIVQSKSTLTDDNDVLTTSPSTTVYDCIDRMVDHDVGSIVVMDGDDIAGIFTERDYMRNIALEGRSSDTTEVQDVMTSELATVDPEKPLEECLQIMTQLRCRHLPVVNDEEELIGMVSIGDCVKQIVDTAEMETARLRQYVTRSYAV